MRKIAALVFCLLCAQGTLHAQQRQPIVVSAAADTVSGLLLVTGVNLANSVVTVDGMQVRVVQSSSQVLVVETPASVLANPGTYLLTVQTSKGTASFVVAIGAIGPQGPRGEQGPQGEAGPQGEQGPQGPQGLEGPAGKDGINGVNGKDGAPGADGLNGKDGAPGANGLNGADGKDGKDGRGALRVVDAAGVELGFFAAPASAIREINGDFVEFPVWNGTLSSCGASCLFVMYADANCQGTAYAYASANLVPAAVINNGVVYYAPGMASTHGVQSYQTIGDFVCSNLGAEVPQDVVPLKSVPLSSFGVGTTFHVAN